VAAAPHPYGPVVAERARRLGLTRDLVAGGSPRPAATCRRRRSRCFDALDVEAPGLRGGDHGGMFRRGLAAALADPAFRAEVEPA
jgi:hypothetical protein